MLFNFHSRKFFHLILHRIHQVFRNRMDTYPIGNNYIGDTGTNMSMTILSAAREVDALENPDMKSLAKAISSGSLRGARGNSGGTVGKFYLLVCLGVNGTAHSGKIWFIRFNGKEKEMQGKKEDVPPSEPEKDMGFVSVSIGEGLNEIFKGLGADYIIEGGQTMNPSTEDVLNAIEQVPYHHLSWRQSSPGWSAFCPCPQRVWFYPQDPYPIYYYIISAE